MPEPSTDNNLKDAFRSDGYVLVKGLLDADEVARYRSQLQKLSGLGDGDWQGVALDGGWTLADGVTQLSDFWPLIFNRRLVEVAREVIGPDARYTQHSDLHAHAGRPAWHRDNVDRKFGVGGDWDESQTPYRIARVAVYLQSHQESGSSLAVIPGSHRRHTGLNSAEMMLWDKINGLRVRRGKPTVLAHFLSLRPVSIRTEPGDCLLFDERILHSATKIRGPKYAMFLSYGGDDAHSRRMLSYWKGRPDARYREIPPELVEKLKQADLYLAPDADRAAVAQAQ